MSKIGLISLAIFGVLFSVSCVHYSNRIIQDPFSQSQNEIRSLLTEIFQTAQKKDFKKLVSYHLDSFKFTKFDDWEPLTRQDAAQAMKTEQEGFSSIDEFNYEIKDLKVDVFGPVAISTFELKYSMRIGKDTSLARARTTMVFVKVKSDWKITHEHFSPYKANPL